MTTREAAELEVGLAAPEGGPRVLAPLGRREATVNANRRLGPYRVITVEDSDGPAPLPGQFYMLASVRGWGGDEGGRPYLGRAFSVCRSRGRLLEFVLEEIGPGTGRLAALGPGEGIWLVGPLGVGFTMPDRLPAARGSARAVLVGGGVGIAPLVIWGDVLAEAAVESLILLGFRSEAHCAAAELVAGDVQLATDDGSVGHPGLVTELLERALDDGRESVVYACGPPAMLESVRRLCAERELPAQLALEEAMACGFGACFGCVVRTRRGYRRICVDGPIVNASDLDDSWHRDE
jgi:dihydroorotate dehydrogenase electron transfer subunit